MEMFWSSGLWCDAINLKSERVHLLDSLMMIRQKHDAGLITSKGRFQVAIIVILHSRRQLIPSEFLNAFRQTQKSTKVRVDPYLLVHLIFKDNFSSFILISFNLFGIPTDEVSLSTSPNKTFHWHNLIRHQVAFSTIWIWMKSNSHSDCESLLLTHHIGRQRCMSRATKYDKHVVKVSNDPLIKI